MDAAAGSLQGDWRSRRQGKNKPRLCTRISPVLSGTRSLHTSSHPRPRRVFPSPSVPFSRYVRHCAATKTQCCRGNTAFVASAATSSPSAEPRRVAGRSLQQNRLHSGGRVGEESSRPSFGYPRASPDHLPLFICRGLFVIYTSTVCAHSPSFGSSHTLRVEVLRLGQALLKEENERTFTAFARKCSA